MVVFYHLQICKICHSSTDHRDLTEENIITKLQKLYSLARNLRVGDKLPALFLKKRRWTGDLLPMLQIFVGSPALGNNFIQSN